MTCSAEHNKTADALALIEAGFDALDSAGVRPCDGTESVAFIKRIERIHRRSDSARVTLMNEIERFDHHSDDGYASVKSMFKHHGRLSNSEANTMHRSAKVCLELPDVDNAHRAGEIPADNLRQLGRLFANPRIKNEVIDQEQWLLSKAVDLRTAELSDKLRIWEDLHDQDGPEPAAERHHNNRNYRFTQGFDGAWAGEHRSGSMQGACMHEVFLHYLEAETMADWDKARAEFGDDAAQCHLERTHAQRSADALVRIYADAAANPNGPVPVEFVHNLVWNQETFEYFLDWYNGEDPEPLDPDLYRCETIDGIQINPIEAMASALVSKVRRVVLNGKGTIIDLGQARHFTGNSRTAVKLSADECIWPSCHVPTSRCETDHVLEHSRKGRTYPGNGAPVCGKHNRWKQKGFTVHKDELGSWHTYRPDGSEIDP